MKKVVLITGASSGMGKEMALLLASKGFTVYGAARRIEKLKELEPMGVHILNMDVTNEATIVNGINDIVNREGRIDVLVNNAGFGYYGAIEDAPISEARYQMEVNVFGAARLIQLVLPHMRKQHYGKIINISSIGGKISMPLGGWYHASKFALEAISDALRAEVKQFGIDVVVIEPGGVTSEWGNIATNNGLKNSGSGAYKVMATKFAALQHSFEKKLAAPAVIANLTLKAITAKQPKTRYAAGFMAKPILTMKKILPDRILDKILLSQLK